MSFPMELKDFCFASQVWIRIREHQHSHVPRPGKRCIAQVLVSGLTPTDLALRGRSVT